MADTCRACLFWGRILVEPRGHCRRMAPAPVIGNSVPRDGDGVLAHWPVTFETEWCGEHKPAFEKPEPVDLSGGPVVGQAVTVPKKPARLSAKPPAARRK